MLTSEPHKIIIMFASARYSSHIFWKTDGNALFPFPRYWNSSITRIFRAAGSWLRKSLKISSHSRTTSFFNRAFPVKSARACCRLFLFSLSDSSVAIKYRACLFWIKCFIRVVFPILLRPYIITRDDFFCSYSFCKYFTSCALFTNFRVKTTSPPCIIIHIIINDIIISVKCKNRKAWLIHWVRTLWARCGRTIFRCRNRRNVWSSGSRGSARSPPWKRPLIWSRSRPNTNWPAVPSSMSFATARSYSSRRSCTFCSSKRVFVTWFCVFIISPRSPWIRDSSTSNNRERIL